MLLNRCPLSTILGIYLQHAKSRDLLTKQSRCMSYYVAITCYLIHQDMQMLKNTIETNPHFKLIYERKGTHISGSKINELLLNDLPSLVVAKIESIFSSNFKQQLTNDSLFCLVSAKPLFFTILCQHLFNLLINASAVKLLFTSGEVHALSLHAFLFNNADSNTMK